MGGVQAGSRVSSCERRSSRSAPPGESWHTKLYRGRGNWMHWAELVIGFYFTGAVLYAAQARLWPAIPFLLLYQFGYLYTAVVSIAQRYAPRLAGLLSPSFRLLRSPGVRHRAREENDLNELPQQIPSLTSSSLPRAAAAGWEPGCRRHFWRSPVCPLIFHALRHVDAINPRRVVITVPATDPERWVGFISGPVLARRGRGSGGRRDTSGLGADWIDHSGASLRGCRASPPGCRPGPRRGTTLHQRGALAISTGLGPAVRGRHPRVAGDRLSEDG